VSRGQLGVIRRGGVPGRRAESGLRVVRPTFGVYRHRLAFLVSRLVVCASMFVVVIVSVFLS
jgi:hypothetical protein